MKFLYIIVIVGLLYIILTEKKGKENFSSLKNCDEQLTILSLINNLEDYNLIVKNNKFFNVEEKQFILDNIDKLPINDNFKQKFC